MVWRRQLAAMLVLALVATGCPEATEPITPSTPTLTFDSAADFAAIKLRDAALCPVGFDIAIPLTARGTVIGVAVTMYAGQPIDLTLVGGADIDTQLFIFGPDDGTGFYGSAPLASNDDGGSGRLSAIAGLKVLTSGGYFIVISARSGTGSLALRGSTLCGPQCGDNVCNDLNPCTTDACVDAAAGLCAFVANQLPCSDGDPCTAGDTCAAGACNPGQPVASCTPCDGGCNDGNPCTDDVCDPATGTCLTTPNSAPCEDGSPCTVGDFCNNRVCIGGPELLDCNDGTPCTQDLCIQACVHEPLPNGAACFNGQGSCQDGACVGTGSCGGLDCDDGNPCTEDLCDPQNGTCINEPLSGPVCAGDDPCTDQGQCDNGICVSAPGGCFDGNPCTFDDCDGNQCLYSPMPDGVPCEEDTPSGEPFVCFNGACVSANCPPDCDDNDPCTADSCYPATGECNNLPLDGTPCPGATGCSGICQGGQCVESGQSQCDDANPCTTDLCQNGCTHLPLQEGTPCDVDEDGVADGECLGGICQSGVNPVMCDPASCDDGNACTEDVCDDNQACENLPVIDGPCEDGDPCTVEDMCLNGTCVGTPDPQAPGCQ